MSPIIKTEEQALALYDTTAAAARSLQEITASTAAAQDYLLARTAQAHMASTFNRFASEMERRVNSVEASVAQISSQVRSGESFREAFRGAILALPSLPQHPKPEYQPEYQHHLHQHTSELARTQPPTHTVRPEVPFLGADSPIEALVIADLPAESNLPRFETVGMDTKWYTKRPMPDFEVKLVHPNGRLCTDTPGWNLAIRLVTGHGIYDNDGTLLRGPGGSVGDSRLVFPIIAGRAIISGLRFQAVSSKNGKTFTMEFSSPGHLTTPSTSAPLVVLSERLKNERKAMDIFDLRPNDDIARVPSLGKAYCQRLNALGFKTVADLASIPVSPTDRHRRLELLNKLRKDRGALTEAKLMQLVRDAHAVVQAEEDRVRRLEEGGDDDDDDDDDDEEDEGEDEDELVTPSTSIELSSPTVTSTSTSTKSSSPPSSIGSRPLNNSLDFESEADLTAKKLSCPLWGQGLLPEEPDRNMSTTPELRLDDMLNFDSMERGPFDSIF